jgi:transposase
MNEVRKQAAGIDVAKQELVVSFSTQTEDGTIVHLSSRSFANNQKGFAALVKTAGQLFTKQQPVHYIMEATGIYYEALAYYLHEDGQLVSVVVPNKVANFFKTLEVKTITDKTAGETIARFGLERKLECWQPPKAIYRRLRNLSRERDQLVSERTEIKNKLHAETAQAFPCEEAIARMHKRIHLLNVQEKEIKSQLTTLVNSDAEVQHQVKLISTIKGVGLISAVVVLSETNGFALIKNKKQLVSYSGLDVREKTSGTSVKGKTSISKKGNKNIRKAMHLPALSAIKHDQRMKAVFTRLVSKHGLKMKAVVAVQRKLLELVYTIFKSDKAYDALYLQKQVEQPFNDCPTQAGIIAA